MSRRKITESLIQLANVRNLLDNGGFEIWQRGVGPFSGSSIYSADRWLQTKSTPSTLSIARETSTLTPNGGKFMLRMSFTISTGTTGQIIQSIENFEEYRGLVLSASVWVKSNTANRIYLRLNDGVGITSSDFNTGTGWEQLTVTRTIDNSATSFGLFIRIENGDAVVDVENVMLVIGNEPVDFVPTPSAEEWDRCQRYFELFGTAAGVRTFYSHISTANYWAMIPVGFISIKPSLPTVTLTTITNINVKTVTMGSNLSTTGTNLKIQATAGGYTNWTGYTTFEVT